MTVFKQKTKKGIVYGVRIRHAGEDIRRIIGPDRKAAELVDAKLRSEIAEARAAEQAWTGMENVRKAKRKAKTFAEAAQEYMDERANLKPSTLARYDSILRNYLLPEFGSMALKDITESHVAKFQARLPQMDVPEPKNKKKETIVQSKKLSPVTGNRIVELFRFILDANVRRGEIVSSPAKNVRRLQEPRAKVDPLSESELEKVLATIDSHYRPLFISLAFTGARPNEMLALRWGDIDWNKQEIFICKGLVRGHEGLPKTAASERTLPMVPRVVEALRLLKASKLASVDDYVFTDKKGAPIIKQLDYVWRVALRRAGIRHRPSYQLRHSFASHCLMKGLSPGYVAKLLGHTTLETMYRHYARWINDASREQERILKGVLGQTTSQPQWAEKWAVVDQSQPASKSEADSVDVSGLPKDIRAGLGSLPSDEEVRSSGRG